MGPAFLLLLGPRGLGRIMQEHYNRPGGLAAVSRAFVKDQDEDQGADDIPDRVVSPHRNLVTDAGLAQIDEELRRSREGLATARDSGDRAEVARHRRDLRYWTQRRSSAEP